MGDKELNIH